jgi:serine/threonine-protein kinase
MTIEVGQTIDGKYKVTQLLGQGGMGAVYAAEHLKIGRRVAIKVLHGFTGTSDVAVTRFEREAQAAGRIGNDHILEVYDFGSLEDGSRFMVCEYLDGETLGKRLSGDQQLTPTALVPIARQLLNGLDAAHAVGVVHRDLKPDNIFLLRRKAGWTDFVKIIDFGISKFSQINDAEANMTKTGMVVGTPTYLSPEQARGSRDADSRSDIYAVGVIMYKALSGKLPFSAPNVNDLLFKIVLETPKPLLEHVPNLDPAFCGLVEKAMARAPENRFQTAAEFAAAIEQWAQERGVSITGPTVTSSNTGSNRAIGDRGSAPPGPGTDNVAVMPTPPTDKVSALKIYGNGTMADSELSAALAEKKRPSKVKYLIAGAVLLVAGAGFAVYKAVGKASNAEVAAGAASATPPTPPSASAAPQPPAAAVVTAPERPQAPADELPATFPDEKRPPPGSQAPAAEPAQQSLQTPRPAAPRPARPAPAPGTPKPTSTRRDWGY